jgi:lysozyme family protein
VRGDAVEAAQQLLCVADDEAGMDGAFDAGPDRAVRDFQRDRDAPGRGRRLSVDGPVGYRTRQAVEAAIAAGGR